MKKLAIPSALLLAMALLATVLAPAALSADGAPVAENLTIETYRGVSVGGSLAAVDPEGGPVTFEITTPPGKGSVDLDEDGHFVYTPGPSRRGKDYFGYCAADAAGNRSQEATVIVRILKQRSSVTYADTAGRDCAYAALRLAEEGLFTGATLAGRSLFEPDRAVTREEFLTLCVSLAGLETPAGLLRTGFADNDAISAWARPYVGAALREGLISGQAEDGGGAVFVPERAITVAEAAVMLDRTLGLTDAVTAWYAFDGDGGLPAWARQSAANLAACGLIPAGVSPADPTLSRGAAAQMLLSAMEVQARR